MPGLDKTGPNGMGPMTGGARGFCSGGFQANFNSSGYGYGRGRGFGRRLANRNRYYQNPVPVYSETSEIEELRAMTESLKNSVEMLNSRIDKMSKEE
ncbi:MAG: DUF5320 domain-containing protein [Thermodesulfobacteriota bacterium]